jgi:hypothetical protein
MIMKYKKILVLFVIFLILGTVVVIQEKSRVRKREYVPSELGILYPSFVSGNVSSITLGSFGGDVVLTKKDGIWFVEDNGKLFPADQEAVDRVFDTTETLEAVQIVSQNPEKHISFQVNAAQESMITDENGESRPFSMGTMGTEVKMVYEDGREAAHFFIGKNGSMDFMSTYIRKAESDTVLLAPGYLKMIFGKGNAAAWKDLLLCQIETNQIASISINFGKERIVLNQVSNATDEETAGELQWKMTEPDRGFVDTQNMQRLTTMFKHFRAVDYAGEQPDPSDYGFDTPKAVIELVLFNSDQKEVFIFGNESTENANQFYLQKEGDDNIYLIPQYRIDSIPRSADDLISVQS